MKTRSPRVQLKRKLLVAALASGLMMLSAPQVRAQSTEAALRGKAPPNGEVSAKNIATGLVRHTKAAEDGSYALVGLPPGTYQVDAGPGTEQIVTLTVASTATLDLAAAAPAKLEAITVTGTTLTEVKTSEVGTTISLHQIQTVPQISRNFLEFADTVPGMQFNVDAKGHTSLRGGAENLSSVNVFIDGVGQKSYVKEGGVSGQFFSQGNPFPQLAIGQYKVITSNYKAEYDQISSAAVTADTKSGTNEFHGEVFGTYTDDGWRARVPAEIAAGNKKTPSHEAEYGFSVGGPIIQDALHFFFTYEHKDFNTPTTVTSGVAGVESLLPPDVQSQFGPAGLAFTEDLYFGKLDWEFSDRDRIEFSAKVRREDQTDNVGGQTAASAGIDTVNDEDRVDLRWQHSADHFYNELLYGYEKAFNNPSSFGSGNGAVYTFAQGSDDRTVIKTDAPDSLATQHKGQKGNSIADTVTLSDFDWHGDHVVKFGAKYKQVDLTAQDQGSDNPQFYYLVTPAGTISQPYKVFFPAAAEGLSPVSKSSNDQFGAFAQDDWAVNDHLTLNLGLRWDYEKTPAYLDYVTPANVVAALNGPNPNGPPGQTYAQALALGGIDVNDYISTGHNRSAQTDEWAPRLGFSYDLNGDQQHVIFGGAGRAYDRDLFDYLALEQTKQALSTFTYYFQGPDGNCYRGGSPCIPFDPRYLQGIENLTPLVEASNVGKEVDAINNHLKTPYSDQFSLGMRNRVGEWNTSAAIARILSKDGFAFTLGHRYPNGDFWASCGPNCISQPWGHPVPGFGNFILGNNGIETRTTQVLLSADKPYTKESHWAATFAYTYTDATHNRDINEHYSFDEATIQDYPFIRSNAAPKHRFVATGTIDGPWGIVLASKLTLATPIPVNQNACYGAVFPNGSPCTPAAGTVGSGNGVHDPNATGAHQFLFGGDVFGYRQIDIQATKEVELPHNTSMYFRFDLLNVFNYRNYADYITNWGSNGVLNSDPVAYNKNGQITGVPRTFKFSMGFRF